MSTSYYNLQEPIGSVRVEEGMEHTKVTLFDTDSANIGVLTFRSDQGEHSNFLCLLKARDAAVTCSSAGAGRVSWHHWLPFRSKVLISEYGTIVRAEHLTAAIDGRRPLTEEERHG